MKHTIESKRRISTSEGIKSYRERLLQEAIKRDKWNEYIDTIQTVCHIFGSGIVIISGLFLYGVIVCMIAGSPDLWNTLAIISGINAFGWLLCAM